MQCVGASGDTLILHHLRLGRKFLPPFPRNGFFRRPFLPLYTFVMHTARRLVWRPGVDVVSASWLAGWLVRRPAVGLGLSLNRCW